MAWSRPSVLRQMSWISSEPPRSRRTKSSPPSVAAVKGSHPRRSRSDCAGSGRMRSPSIGFAPSAVLFRQVRNPILLLLLGAALVSGLTGGGTNAVIIAVIVFLSVGLGFFNEYRAERAMASLRAQIRQEAEVRRNGQTCRMPVTELVPGDVVALRIGALVPADLRLLDVDQCECDEGILTGESMPVVKSVSAVTGRVTGPAGVCLHGNDRSRGIGARCGGADGSRTAFGQIAAGLSERQGQTAFEVGLSRFSRFLFGVAALLTAFIFIVNVALSRPLIEALLFSLAIAVGIAPEMMPAIVTVSLSSGSKALAAKKVLVKRLVAIEDLGNIEILFTDKTGTLTEGLITYERGIDPAGHVSDPPLLLGLVCNESAVTEHGPGGGNTLDQALWSAPGAAAAGDLAVKASSYVRKSILPFDHARQLASVLVEGPDGRRAGGHQGGTRGGPGPLSRRPRQCPVRRGCVVLRRSPGGGGRQSSRRGHECAHAADEQGLELAGFLTFADRPKADAGASIAQLERLGVDVKIITGDNGLVAAKVCLEIGLDCAGVLNGEEVEALMMTGSRRRS